MRKTRFVATSASSQESRVQGLNYSYTGMAWLDPVRVGPDQNSGTKGEFVVFTYSTSQDGAVMALDAYRASSKTRDALAAVSKEQASPKPTG
ncbi:hypothetical protein ACWD0G_29985 [Streptomyces goshikiensis]